MYCPTCHQRTPDGARVCPFCGTPLPVGRRSGGAGLLAALLVCAALFTVGLDRGGGRKNAALELFAPESPAEIVEEENPPRGDAVQVKEGQLGSAGYLRGDVLLISLYINDERSAWNAEQEENARACVDVACRFLVQQAKNYGEELRFYYDVQEHPDLRYRAQFEADAEQDMTGRFTRWLYRWIDENVPVAELQERYGTENVGFLALVAEEGGAYTNVYYIEDTARYFNEISVLFYYYSYLRSTDREVPAVYAHEILHQFGAIDLYEDSPDFSPENIAYVAETYPDDIMYSTYTDNGRLNYESIHLEVSPVTAYYLGWLDELPEADQEGLTDYERVCVAGFSYDDPTFSEDE